MSALSALKNYLVAGGQRLRKVLQPEKKPAREALQSHPKNIIGLPRLLTRDRGKRLLLEARLTLDAWDELLRDPDTVKWMAHRGRTFPRDTLKRIFSVYGDLRLRQQRIKRIESAKQNKQKWSLVRNSLELNLLLNYFPESARHIDELTPEGLRNAFSSVGQDPLLSPIAVKLCMRLSRLTAACVLVLGELSKLLPKWASLQTQERERVALGVFLLTSVSVSLLPLEWALRQVPELASEFINLRPVYRRARRRHRPPTRRQKCRIRRLWQRQVSAIDRQLREMHSQSPSSAQVLRLHRQARSLWLINRTRSRHRHLIKL